MMNKAMKPERKMIPALVMLLGMNLPVLFSQSSVLPEPVTPDASREAKALLGLLYDISGQYTLTGQHNYPNIRDRNSRFAARYIGKTPAVFSTDWGFAGVLPI
jgi:hypothetical protein